MHLFFRLLAAHAHEKAFDEVIEIAIHDRNDIAGFYAGAMIFHHIVRVEDVAANLTSERDVLLLAANLVERARAGDGDLAATT